MLLRWLSYFLVFVSFLYWIIGLTYIEAFGTVLPPVFNNFDIYYFGDYKIVILTFALPIIAFSLNHKKISTSVSTAMAGKASNSVEENLFKTLILVMAAVALWVLGAIIFGLIMMFVMGYVFGLNPF